MDEHVYDQARTQAVEERSRERWRREGTHTTPPAQAGQEHVYYLDMFPYPSGSGLHVGHPLGFVATDVAARYARMNGKHVLHTMGFDAFGLPAEQYAISTGQHPEVTTRENIATYRQQISRLGLGHDPERSVSTTDPAYYRWTQWAFLVMHDSWYDEATQQARPVSELVAQYESGERASAEPWETLDEAARADLVDSHRLAYRKSAPVNWCPGLGTVLADAEVTESGRSERGNFPVHSVEMTQWLLRISAYAPRLVGELEGLDWPESLKALQRNWILDDDGNVKMRDWLFSRQRYWGEPFPIVYDETGRAHALPASMLPVLLPDTDDFTPPQHDPEDTTSVPEPPLARLEEWVNVTLDLGDGPKRYRRETSTMPNWAGSCWYFLRYLDPNNPEQIVDPEIERYWMGPTKEKPRGGVDLYVGGTEHAVLHLLYARFWHKVLFDRGHVSSEEPFHRLVNQGYVQAWAYENKDGMPVPATEVEERDGKFWHAGEEVARRYGKMGKSLKNAVTPDEVCDEYGADTFRIHLMGAAPLEASRPWDTRTISGSHKLVQRLWRLVVAPDGSTRTVPDAPDPEVAAQVGAYVTQIREAYSTLRLNVAVARIGEAMGAVNRSVGDGPVPAALAETMVKVLAPLAPHVTEELWERLGHEGNVVYAPFPEGAQAPATEVTYPVQVNGKVRASIVVPEGTPPEEVQRQALAEPNVARHLVGPPQKVRVVPGRIVSIVT